MQVISAGLSKVFGSRNQRLIKKLSKVLIKINAFEAACTDLSDAALQEKTVEFKARLAKGETLDQLLPEAFAVVREASQRTLGLRHFDVQMLGGMVLHQGKIAEMCTGEGKTLVATLAAYLNALTERGVYIVTVNDYLAARDAAWMAPIYEFLGLRVGVIVANMPSEDKREAYQADIIYGTNNEFGFDYLRDNMTFSLEEKTQRHLHYAIVDEVDSILIDESRTPLIISGAAEDSSALYIQMDKVIVSMTRQEDKDADGDFYVDEKNKQVFLSETGHERAEALLLNAGMIQAGESLYDIKNIILMHHLNAALRANHLFSKDVDYIVKDNEIVIVDEHTGRTMQGRRWSEGLHQALEAKEGVNIQNENQTLASTTFQNYFRLFDKLSGMTGTADTEAYEFHEIYGLEVVVMPTNQPMVRDDQPDFVYLSSKDKFAAIIEDIIDSREKKQPVLVGTVSIETSQYLSDLLTERKVPHNVLNAKFHEKEAEIIAEAGRPGSITIATNMAGRGTDIVLGGNIQREIEHLDNPDDAMIAQCRAEWEKRHAVVLQAGGLKVIGTERHESRRIDNQLRGRSGRQGDKGASRFYLSLDDSLLRIFASPRMKAMMQRVGMGEGDVLESKMLTRAIENAQRKVEAHHFDIRKQLLEYDDVANDQRQLVYHQREELLSADVVESSVAAMRQGVMRAVVQAYVPLQSMDEQWDIAGLEQCLQSEFALKLPLQVWLDQDEALDEEGLHQRVLQALEEHMVSREAKFTPKVMRQFEKTVMLQTLDQAWKEHLAAMDHLRQGIHLRGYAQKNPKQEYKREAFDLFTRMLAQVKREVLAILSAFEVDLGGMDALEEQRRQQQIHYDMAFSHADPEDILGEASASDGQGDEKSVPFVRPSPKVGRNDLCPCESGKKYKHCHGRLPA